METNFRIPVINKLKHMRVNYSQPLEISNFSIGMENKN